MPVVTVRPDRLKTLLGKEVPDETLLETIPMLGADVDDVQADEWSIEFFPNRPDLFSVEGIARALRAYMEIDPGPASYDVDPPTTHIDVDDDLEDVRPYIGGAWVRGLDLDDETIQDLMAIQEDLHWGLGGRRRKVAIGVHDASALTPPFRYAAVDRDGIAFTPLTGPEERESMGREMTPGEILAEHPKGVEYAGILDDHDRVPIILDDNDAVLSFPPIINGTLTTVTSSTTELFIDTTGTDLDALTNVLAILVTSLAEAGGDVEQVEIRDGTGRTTPDLDPETWTVPADDANDLLGTDLAPDDVAAALRRAGHGATADGGDVSVQVPAYRADILHPVDLIEDVAIGAGYGDLSPAKPEVPTTGEELPWRARLRRVREVLVGLGFLETMSLTLSSDAVEHERTRRPETPGVQLANPVSEEQARPRQALLPSLIDLLARNTHRDLPQSVFETGHTIQADGGNQRRVAFVRAATKTGFDEAKGLTEAVVADALDAELDVEPADDPLFVEGRAAEILVDGTSRGVLGEVHPEVLDRFEIQAPVIGAEIVLD